MLKKTEKFGPIVEAAMLKCAAFQQATVDVPKEVQLQEGRDRQGLSATPEGTMEARLGDVRTGGTLEPYELLMKEHRAKVSALNSNLAVGTTEARLNRADRKPYPHRNPDAWARTGEKRPVNSLREEMGEASDPAKRERYEKAIQAQPTTKRVVDKDQGSQLPFKPFNSRGKRVAALEPYNGYLAYRAAGEVGEKNTPFAEVASLDLAISRLVSAAAAKNRPLSEDEQAAVGAMKNRKTAVLRGTNAD